MTENKTEVPVESQLPDLASLLAKFKGSPTSEKIEEWKQEFGEVFCSGLSETELFLFRPLTWSEHKTLQKQLSTPPKEGEQAPTEEDYQESVVRKCLLWTSNDRTLQKGGTIPTLYEQVMANSNFVNPALAAALVIRL